MIGGAERFHPFPLARSAVEHALQDLPAAFAWSGPLGDWRDIVLGSIGLIVASIVVSTALHRLAMRRGARRFGALVWIVALLATGTVLQFALPFPDRVRALAFAIFAGYALVAIALAFTTAALRSAYGVVDRPAIVAVGLCLGCLVGAYLVIGLMKLSAASAPGRAATAFVFWTILLLLAFHALRAILMLHRAQAAPRQWTLRQHFDDPVHGLLTRRPDWFFGLVLCLIGLITFARILRDEPGAFLGGAVALQLLGVLAVIVGWLGRATRGRGEPATWTSVLARVATLLAFIGFWLVLGWAFEIDLFSLASNQVGERAVRTLIDIGIALALGFLFWQIAEAGLGMLSTAAVGGTAPSRIETFVPLLRAILMALTIAASGMIVLAALGVNIAPLLAGAGIFGIAIGFGSQALVKDVISGVFYLSDDAFRVGEYINVGKAEGSVESLSIRSMKLRHPNGPIFTVPFGDIGVINNQSRDWVLVKLDFLLDFRTDLTVAKRVVKRISKEVEADPALGANLISPLKFQGVKRMEPHGMVIGTKFVAGPGQQYELRREFFARLRDGFAAAGIQFARPRVFVDTANAADPVDAETLGAAATTVMPPDAEKG